MLSDSDDELDSYGNDFINKVKSSGALSEQDRTELLHTFKELLGNCVTLSAKAEFLEKILIDTDYHKTALNLVIPRMQWIYPQLTDPTQRVNQACYVAAKAPDEKNCYKALNFLAQSYEACPSNNDKIKALSLLLRDPRKGENKERHERFEQHQHYYEEWTNCFNACPDSNKAYQAAKLLNNFRIYDTFKLDVLRKLYHYLPHTDDPQHGMSLIVFCNQVWTDSRHQIENHPELRINTTYLPRNGFDWEVEMHSLSRRAIKKNGYEKTIESLDEEIKRMPDCEEWLTNFATNLKNNQASLLQPSDFKKSRRTLLKDSKHHSDPVDVTLLRDNAKLAKAQVIYKSQAIAENAGLWAGLN